MCECVGGGVLCSLFYADSTCISCCVFHHGLLDLFSTSSLVVPPSLPSACFTLMLSAHTLMHIQLTHTHTPTASLYWSHHPLWSKDSHTNSQQGLCLTNHPQTEKRRKESEIEIEIEKHNTMIQWTGKKKNRGMECWMESKISDIGIEGRRKLVRS